MAASPWSHSPFGAEDGRLRAERDGDRLGVARAHFGSAHPGLGGLDERDLAVAEYGLLAAMGLLTARNLELPVEYYDPTRNYGEVRNKWIGFDTASDE